MKKIFSLFCAMVLVLSANASSQLKGRHFSPKANNLELKAQLPTDISELSVTHNRMVASGVAKQKLPAAVNDTVVTVDYVQALYLGSLYEYYGYSGIEEWDFQFFDGDNFILEVDVIGVDGKHIAGTYDLASEDNGGVLVVAAGDTVDIVSGSLAVAYDVEAAGYTFKLKATCSNNKTYTLSYACAKDEVFAMDYYSYILYQYGYADSFIINLKDAPVVGGQTIEVVIPGYTMLDWYEETGDFYVYAFNDSMVIIFDWFPTTAGSPLGDYTSVDDFDFEYCGVYTADEELAVDSVKLHVTSANDTIYMDVTLYAEDANIYHALLKNYTIVPTKTVNVVFAETGVDAETMADYGVVEFYGDGADYVCDLYLVLNDGGTGHYTEEDIISLNNYSYIGDYATMKYLFIVSGSFDVTVEGGVYSLTGSLVCSNEIQYNISISGAAQAIEQVNGAAVKAVKTIREGQVVIERNGVEYNVLGAQMK
ncbi:MAG: hypothetical protein ACI4TV_06370 [Paludibacteraceae bacterium]